MRSTNLEQPPDHRERLQILSDLDTTMLVEAAAGTGKTTILIGRMVALLAEGKSAVETMAAVTFTRKAATELRARFQTEVERAFRQSGGRRRERLSAALSGIDRCFIGTIHSFCARLLRERPVEAGVDVMFEEMDEADDRLLRQTAWNSYVARLYAEDHPILQELEELGVEIGRLRATFMKVADYPDVGEWPAEKIDLPDLNSTWRELRLLVDHLESLAPSLPPDPGKDKLIEKYKLIVRMHRQIRMDSIPELMEILAEFTDAKTSAKSWPGGKAQAQEEKERWDRFRADYAEPMLRLWREHCYEPCLRSIKPALEEYDRLKATSGKMNYQDLLMFSARLLRDKPNVRGYFRTRFTHLLVDEFQDTDPVQAEVMLLLTARDLHETDWRSCRPVDGSLFVVGDPKQSIYRFRRADIVTYNQVKQIIENSGGRVVGLSANFRSGEPVIEWVNSVFHDKFPVEPSDYSPQYVALTAALGEVERADFGGVRPLMLSGSGNFREYEAELIARIIRYSLDNRLTLPRSQKDLDKGVGPEATPGDFLIITPKKANLGVYARKLEEMEVPHQVTGGDPTDQVSDLSLLHTCLVAATQPGNPVSLVAALRSELFGISDAALYRFKRSGGIFSFLSEVPDGLAAEEANAFGAAFHKLRKYGAWLSAMPVVPAIENIVADTGLAVRAALGSAGNIRAGGLVRAPELLRNAQSEMWSMSQAVNFLADLLTSAEDQDGVPARADESSMVRVMNLHKAKGLEAPVVFLADPTPFFKDSASSIDLYVDRSGDRVHGYLQMRDSLEGRWNSSSVIAQPPRWDSCAARELEFLKQENVRLFYVAATRAGAELIISQRQKGQHFNPWRFFQPKLENLPPVVDPGPQQAPRGTTVHVTTEDVSTATKAIDERWQVILAPTYKVSAAKSLVVADRSDYPGTQHGTEWGNVIHMILQVAMTDKDANLTAVARDALAEQNLEASLAEEAVAAAQSVIDSEIWKRASSALKVLVEVPFETLWAEGATCEFESGVIAQETPSPSALPSREGDLKTSPGSGLADRIFLNPSPTEGESRAPALDPSPLAGEGGERGSEELSAEELTSMHNTEASVPLLVRGVIDLAFLEPNGWVIVDYKTDRHGPERLQELASHYKGQVLTYAKIWEKITGERVREAGLYFTHAGKYVELDSHG